MNYFFKKFIILHLSLSCLLVLSGRLDASMNFTNRASAVMLKPTNSKLRLGKASAVTGWTQESIVKSFGNNASSLWTEAYSNGDIVTQDGSGTKIPATNLIYSNSNAIAFVASGMNNSNSIAWLNLRIKNDSDSLFALNHNSSNSIMYLDYAINAINTDPTIAAKIHQNSQTILYLDDKTRANSNYTFETIRNNSQAVAYLSLRVRNDSNTMMANTLVWPSMHTVASDEIVQNFTYFQNGLTINDGKTITVSSPITVDSLTVGSGAGAAPAIVMNEDMYLKSVDFNASQSAAKIFGNNHALFMEGDWNVESGKTLNINSSLVIDGQGHELKFAGAGQLFVDSNVSVTLQNMTLKLGDVNGLSCYYNSELTLNNVVLDLDSDFTITSGRVHIQDLVNVRNSNSKTMGFVPDTAKGLCIYPHAVLSFDNKTTFTYDGGSASPRNKIWMADPTALMYVNGSTLKTGVNGLSLAKGTLILDNKVTLNNGLNSTALQTKGITLGDGTYATNDMNVEILSGAQVEVLGYLHWNPANPFD